MKNLHTSDWHLGHVLYNKYDRGEGSPWKGNYSSWLDQKTTRMAVEGKTVWSRTRRCHPRF